MALSEKTICEKLEIIDPNGLPFIRCVHAELIERDGFEIMRTNKTHLIHPDTDVSGEDAVIQALAASLFTDEVKAAWAAKNAPEEVPAE